MADAGKLLIPESMRKGKDIKEYSPEDLARLEEHFHNVCDQQQVINSTQLYFVSFSQPMITTKSVFFMMVIRRQRPSRSFLLCNKNQTKRVSDPLPDQQQEFIEWEGPRQDPRVLLAHNRLARQEQHQTDGATGMAESGVGPSDTGTAVPKFRLVLPIGQEPPPGYVQVGTRSLPMGDLDDDQLGTWHF